VTVGEPTVVAVGTICTVWFTVSDALAGETLRPVRLEPTFTVIDPAFVGSTVEVAVITAVPEATAVTVTTVPLTVTEATAGALDAQLTVLAASPVTAAVGFTL
jgi:hypothetical protein